MSTKNSQKTLEKLSKAELVKLCKKMKLTATGTCIEMRNLIRVKKGQPAKLHISKMTKPQLEAKCEELGIPSSDTCNLMRNDIRIKLNIPLPQQKQKSIPLADGDKFIIDTHIMNFDLKSAFTYLKNKHEWDDSKVSKVVKRNSIFVKDKQMYRVLPNRNFMSIDASNFKTANDFNNAKDFLLNYHSKYIVHTGTKEVQKDEVEEEVEGEVEE